MLHIHGRLNGSVTLIVMRLSVKQKIYMTKRYRTLSGFHSKTCILFRGLKGRHHRK